MTRTLNMVPHVAFTEEDDETLQPTVSSIQAPAPAVSAISAMRVSPLPRRQTAWWWVLMFIGYTAFLIFLGVKGADAILERQATGKVPTDLLPESSLWKTDKLPDLSVASLEASGYLYSLGGGKAVVEELISLQKKAHGSVKPALDRASAMFKENRHLYHACHPVLDRFAYINYREGKHGILSALAGAIGFDSAEREEVEAIMSGRTLLESGNYVRPNKLPLLAVDALMICSGAYLHGVIRTFLFEAGSAGQIEAAKHFIERRLYPRLENNQRAIKVCRQAVGHAFYDHRRHFWRVQMMAEALALIPPVRSKSKDRFTYLASGIYMAFYLSSSIWSHDIDDPAELFSVCADPLIQKRSRGKLKACVEMAPYAFLTVRLGSYIEGFEWCIKGCSSAFPDQIAGCEAACVGGVGRSVVQELTYAGGDSSDWAYIARVCDRVPRDDLLGYCMLGAKGILRRIFATENFDVTLCSGIETPRLADACRDDPPRP